MADEIFGHGQLCTSISEMKSNDLIEGKTIPSSMFTRVLWTLRFRHCVVSKVDVTSSDYFLNVIYLVLTL
jgi:hypothetical protein